MGAKRKSVLSSVDGSTSINSTQEEILILNSDGYRLRKDSQSDNFSDTDSAEEILTLNVNGYGSCVVNLSDRDSDESLSGDEIEEANDLDNPQENMTAAGWKKHIWPVLRTGLLPVLSTLSSISTMYAAKDVVGKVLTKMGYTLDDIDSIGEDEEKLSQLFAEIAALGTLWGIPMVTIIANSVMRFFGAIKTKEFLQKLVQKNSVAAYLWLVVYLAFALPTSISDTLINVLTSDTLKDKWLPMFIKGEGVLSLVFLLPLNLYFMHILHQRLQCAWDKYSKEDDRKLLSRRLEVISYELINMLPGDQAAKLKELCRTDFIDGKPLPTTYDDLMALSPEQWARLAEMASKNANLPDGSSWGSTAATAVTAAFAFSAGAAIMRSPYVFYTTVCEFPSAAAWFLSAISGLTKSVIYIGSYDNLMWCAKNYTRLFGSAPFLYGAGAVLLALSAAGFWEVGELSLAAVFEKVAADPTWWFEFLNTVIYCAGVAANTSSAASLAVEKGEEKRQNELRLNENPDLAMGFQACASQALNPPKKKIADEEGLQNMVTDRENAPDVIEDADSPPTERFPRSERSSETSWCAFFSGCVSSITPRGVSRVVNTVFAPCFN